MDTAWRVIDCSSAEGSLHSRRGQILVALDSGVEQILPTADISVLLLGPHMSFSAAVVHRLLSSDVVVLFCDWRGVPEGAACPWHEHTRIGARQIAQAALSQPRRKNAWGRIVKAKVQGQQAVLEKHNPLAAKALLKLAASVRSGDPSNVEAQAARFYWEHLFAGDEDFLREPRGVAPRNNCLDYGYGVLRAHGVRAVVAAGLSPTLGLFHHGRSNAFNLVDDLIEPFRPAVDQTVAALAVDASPESREIKQLLVSAVEQPFDSSGATLPTVLEKFAQQLGRYVEGDVERLEVPVWTGGVQE